jgi:SAM-dependent methyltransferase
MACLFGLLGAHVTAVELPGKSLEPARAEARRWHLEKRVCLKHYDGDLRPMAGAEFDFVFSKSVLVIVPDLPRFARQVASVLSAQGRLLAAENMQRGTMLRKMRARAVNVVRPSRFGKDYYSGFRGVTPSFLDTLREAFDIVSYRESYGLVAAIEARKKA